MEANTLRYYWGRYILMINMPKCWLTLDKLGVPPQRMDGVIPDLEWRCCAIFLQPILCYIHRPQPFTWKVPFKKETETS